MAATWAPLGRPPFDFGTDPATLGCRFGSQDHTGVSIVANGALGGQGQSPVSISGKVASARARAGLEAFRGVWTGSRGSGAVSKTTEGVGGCTPPRVGAVGFSKVPKVNTGVVLKWEGERDLAGVSGVLLGSGATREAGPGVSAMTSSSMSPTECSRTSPANCRVDMPADDERRVLGYVLKVAESNKISSRS